MSRSTTDWQTLLAGSTPGPWAETKPPYTVDAPPELFSVSGELIFRIGEETDHPYKADGNLTLAASAPEAVAEVIRLRESIEKLADHWQSLDISTYQDTTRPMTVSFSEAVTELRKILRGAV